MELVFIGWYTYLHLSPSLSSKNMNKSSRKRSYSSISEDKNVETKNNADVHEQRENENYTKTKLKKATDQEDRPTIEHTSVLNEINDLDFKISNISEYERKRQENVRDNVRFMASIGIFQAKHMFDATMPVKQKTNPKSKQKTTPKPKRVYTPTRRSARIQRIDPSGISLPSLPDVAEQEEKMERKPLGPLKMSDLVTNENTEDIAKVFAADLKSLSDAAEPLKLKTPTSASLQSFLSGFSRVKVTENQVRKVVESRIFSVVMHPSKEKILVGAGGKWGSIGLWDVGQGLADGGAVCFNPHTKPVNCLAFNPYNLDQLYSCSYDGTLRCGYFEKGIFEAIYYTPEEDDVLLRNFSFFDANTLFVSQSDGDVAIVDIRTKSGKPENLFTASHKGLRSVDIHPVKREYFVTAGLDCTVSLWDLRATKKKPNKICSMSASRMVDSAYFSPLTGKYILSTAQDDRIRIYDSSKLSSSILCLYSISHNNQTGRWLTKFRATWHPCREDLFISGSMNRPRQVELINNEGRCMMVLHHPELINSVQSLNEFHPTINAVVGANASGKLHVFK
ncbi:repeat-containing 76-like [Octopus vulgaris]|uniref:WD repeat-containing protein 76 n=1 Tax=Octopus vulgaris TaxID=6645 RepID=A0AA36BVM4_OCTVU|nr:repeat-containing 76-like [Octopus vulgaris]